MRRHFISLLAALACGAALGAPNVTLVGVIGDRAAVFAAEGGEPKVVRVGQSWNGLKVISVRDGHATVEIEGRRRVLTQGTFSEDSGSDGRQSVTLSADDRGHFLTMGAINGNPVRFLVDTGATVVSLPGAVAERLGIDYRKGTPGITSTANGQVRVYRVRLDRVNVGAVALSGVDAVVIERGLDVALLGMSFLNRVEMTRDGQTMTLTRRF